MGFLLGIFSYLEQHHQEISLLVKGENATAAVHVLPQDKCQHPCHSIFQ